MMGPVTGFLLFAGGGGGPNSSLTLIEGVELLEPIEAVIVSTLLDAEVVDTTLEAEVPPPLDAEID